MHGKSATPDRPGVMKYELSDFWYITQTIMRLAGRVLHHTSTWPQSLSFSLAPTDSALSDNRPTAKYFSFIWHTPSGGPNQNVNIWLHRNVQTVQSSESSVFRAHSPSQKLLAMCHRTLNYCVTCKALTKMSLLGSFSLSTFLPDF